MGIESVGLDACAVVRSIPCWIGWFSLHCGFVVSKYNHFGVDVSESLPATSEEPGMSVKQNEAESYSSEGSSSGSGSKSRSRSSSFSGLSSEPNPCKNSSTMGDKGE